MDDALKRAGWIIVLVIAGSYFTFAMADFVFNRTNSSTRPTVIRDIQYGDEHHLTGVILVPSTCDQIKVSPHDLGENSFHLEFTTWDEPSVKCFNAPAERFFDTVVFAATSSVRFKATLNKKEIPIAVFSSIQNN